MRVQSQFIEMFGNSIHTKKLIEVCNIEKGSTITKEQTSNGDIPVVAGGLEPSCYHNVANRPAGMITVSASGANAGYVNYWEVPIFASDCNTIYPIELEKVSPIFMYWQLKVIQKQIYKLQKGGAQPHVYGKDLADMQIVQPPMEFQLRYVKIAEQADKSKFVGFKSQFIEMFSKYPSETPWHKLLTIINGKAYPEEYNNIGTYPICGSAGIMYYGERKLCDANTIILGRKGNINHPIYMESDYWIVDTAFCLDVNKSILLPKYFYYWCCQYDFTKLNKQGVLPSLARKDLEKIEMSVPPMAEQKKFVSIVEQADKSKYYN